MSPLQLTTEQKIDLILDLLNESHRKQISLERSIVDLKIIATRHKVILTGYGAIIGSTISTLIASYI